MQFDEPTLKRLYETPPIGVAWPYASGSRDVIETYLRETVSDLEASALISLEAVFNSYGSGYASYVEVFCYKKDGSSSKPYLNGPKITGIVYCISRHAPFVAFGSQGRYRRSGSLPFDNRSQLPKGDWDAIPIEVTEKLRQRGFEIPSEEILAQPLPFEITLDTNLSDPPYSIFDLLFFWYD